MLLVVYITMDGWGQAAHNYFWKGCALFLQALIIPPPIKKNY